MTAKRLSHIYIYIYAYIHFPLKLSSHPGCHITFLPANYSWLSAIFLVSTIQDQLWKLSLLLKSQCTNFLHCRSSWDHILFTACTSITSILFLTKTAITEFANACYLLISIFILDHCHCYYFYPLETIPCLVSLLLFLGFTFSAILPVFVCSLLSYSQRYLVALLHGLSRFRECRSTFFPYWLPLLWHLNPFQLFKINSHLLNFFLFFVI